MAEKTMTQKMALTVAIEHMERVGETEVCEVLKHMLEQKSKVREHKVKPEVEMFREQVLALLKGAEAPMTNKMVAEALGVSPQKASAALRFLKENGLIVRQEGEKKSDPATFVA